MKYEVHAQGHRLEAVGTLHGYRIRISTLATPSLVSWPVSVHVRGSESEPEVRVDTPKQLSVSPEEALKYGYNCARLWIEAMDHHGYFCAAGQLPDPPKDPPRAK
jgi:hypothetical protein